MVDKLSRAVTEAMADPSVQAQLRAQGMEPVAVGSAAFRRQMAEEIARYRSVVQRARIPVE